MSTPQKIFPLPKIAQPKGSPIGPKKAQNDPKKAKNQKASKQKILQNESYQPI